MSKTRSLDPFKRWMQQKREQLQKLQITTEERKRDPRNEEESTCDPFIGYVHESVKAIGQVTVWVSGQMEFEVININTEERLLWTYVEQIEDQDSDFETILEPYFSALQSGI